MTIRDSFGLANPKEILGLELPERGNIEPN